MKWLRAVLIAYLVAIHAALAVGGVKVWRHLRAPNSIDTMRAVHRQMDPSVPAGAVLFLGDSTTIGLVVAAVAPMSVNYGIGYQRSDHLLGSMDVYRSMERASVVVVMIGTNDIREGLHTGIEDRYRSILAKTPGAVVLVSPPPFRNERRNRFAREVAGKAKASCESSPRCTFVDGYALLSEDGKPIPGVLLEDGIHLTHAGYARLIAAISSGVRQAHKSTFAL